MVRQLNPLGSGTSFQVSLIVPSQLAPNSTIMWLKPLLEMNYTEFPIYVPSSCELSKYKRVLTHPITQSHNSRIWCSLSRVCILYRELCVCVLYWGVVYDVCGFEKADEEAKRQLTDPQREPRGGSAKGRLHYTPCGATREAYSWRPDGIGAPEKGWRETRGEVTEELKRFTAQGIARGVFFIWGGTFSFLRHRIWTQNCHSSHSQCNPGLACYLKELLPRRHWIISSRG